MYAEPSSAVIRRPTEQDLDSLAELVYRFYVFNEEFDPSWATPQNLREQAARRAAELLKSEDSVVLVAAKANTIVGYVVGTIEENPLVKVRRILVLREIYVRPQERRQGIATQLVNKALEEARKLKASHVAVEFPAGNRIAEELYLKMGFRPYLVRLIKEV